MSPNLTEHDRTASKVRFPGRFPPWALIFVGPPLTEGGTLCKRMLEGLEDDRYSLDRPTFQDDRYALVAERNIHATPN